jgi:uncharacterized membrane protein
VAALAASGLRRPALVASVASTLLVVGYDLRILDDPQRWWAAAAVAAGVLVVSVVTSSVALLAGHVALASAALSGLLDGKQLGAALLVLAAGHAALAVALRARRLAYACALGVAALAVAAPASTLVLHGTWLVLAWAATAASLGVLAVSGERLLPGAVAYLGLAVAHVLALEAPPSDVFVAHRHPGGGIPAVLAVVAACAIVARRSAALREALAWLGGGLALYAATLGILELFEDAGSGVDAAFQRGHTGVSALWGAVGLVLLVAGLKREARRLRVGGFALFGISLAKLFLYDLAFLSSLARAASFLAVGGVLLVGGFFYQRLGTEAELDSPA